MPEGPEVAAYADKLNNLVAGQRLLKADFLSGRYKKVKPEGFTSFNMGLRLGSVGVKGKFLFFEFTKELPDGNIQPDCYIWNTLGLTGGWHDCPHEYARLRLEFETQVVWYFDMRNFGTFHFDKSLSETAAKLDTLGVDFLRDEVSMYDTEEIFSRKSNQNKTLAEILMNQENYAGVGNYIKAEALYLAKLSPHRLGKDVTSFEQKLLHYAIDKTMRSAYYDRPNFQKVIYKAELSPEGEPVISESTKDKRTTWWVPTIQK